MLIKQKKIYLNPNTFNICTNIGIEIFKYAFDTLLNGNVKAYFIIEDDVFKRIILKKDISNIDNEGVYLKSGEILNVENLYYTFADTQPFKYFFFISLFRESVKMVPNVEIDHVKIIDKHNIKITVRNEDVTVINDIGLKHYIPEIYTSIYIQLKDTPEYHISNYKNYKTEFYLCDVFKKHNMIIHPHTKKDDNITLQHDPIEVCLGERESSEIAKNINNNKSISSDNIFKDLLLLRSYLEYESIDGVPYTRLFTLYENLFLKHSKINIITFLDKNLNFLLKYIDNLNYQKYNLTYVFNKIKDVKPNLNISGISEWDGAVHLKKFNETPQFNILAELEDSILPLTPQHQQTIDNNYSILKKKTESLQPGHVHSFLQYLTTLKKIYLSVKYQSITTSYEVTNLLNFKFRNTIFI